jgi:hypothetical protein
MKVGLARIDRGSRAWAVAMAAAMLGTACTGTDPNPNDAAGGEDAAAPGEVHGQDLADAESAAELDGGAGDGAAGDEPAGGGDEATPETTVDLAADPVAGDPVPEDADVAEPGPDAGPEDVPDVPYFYQYDNDLYPGSTCQNTSIAMVLAWLGWKGEPDDITASWGKDWAQDPAGLAEVFNAYAESMGIPERLHPVTNGTIAGMKALLDQGRPVIVHGYFTAYGHVMVTLGYTAGEYIVNDPAGKWSQVFKGGYPYASSSTAGDHIHYGAAAFEAAVATSDGSSFLPLWYHALK